MLVVDRSTFLFRSIMLLQIFQPSRVEQDIHHNPQLSAKQATYHKPPPEVDYSTNETVFGKILRGESEAAVWNESQNLLLFQDIHPRAPTHGLIIPKRFIESVFDLTPADVPLLEEMHSMALETLRERHGEALEKGDYNLCFHVPPFNSVDHLHLHVLAPKSSMRFYYRLIKYNTAMRWSVSIDTVLDRLQQGLPAVPYQKPKTLTSMKRLKA